MPLGIFSMGAKNQARRDAYNRAVDIWEEQRDEKKRQYKYQKQTLKILKRNTEANLAYQDQSNLQEYNYEVAAQKFVFDTEAKARERSIQEALGKTKFADLAEQQANLQQDRYLLEQEIALDLEQEQSALDYRFASAGLAVDKRKAKQTAVTDIRKASVAGLKARGQAAARGQAGRVAAKNQQALLAETAATQNDIVNNLFNTNLAIDLDLRKLSDQLVMDKTALDLSRKSLKASDKIQRMAFKQQKLQAYMNAAFSIEDRPEMGPPIPKPFALPRPEFQEVYKPNFKLGKPEIDDFGRKIGLGETLLADGLKIGGAVLTGVTAGATAGAAGLNAAAGTSGILGMSQTTAAGVGAGLGSFLSQ